MNLTVKSNDSKFNLLIEKYEKLDIMKVAGIIEDKIKENYDKSQNFDNSKMTKLKPATIKHKRELGASNPSKPLLLTHQLKKATTKRKITEREAHIFIRDNSRGGGVTNSEILDYQKKYGRKPFGLTNALAEVKKYIESILGN